MPTTLRNTDILFNDSSVQSTAVPATLRQIRQKGWAWSSVHGTQNSRGARYVSRYRVTAYTTDGYGNPTYTTTSLGNDSITWTTGARPQRVVIEYGAYTFTDDYFTFQIIRDGSIVNATTHSGGTVIAQPTSGVDGLQNGSLGEYSNQAGVLSEGHRGQFWMDRVTDDIPANTTRTYFYYLGVLSGSGADGLQSHFSISLGAIL